ncbi:MAG TPA: DUF1015 domain-containing protein [Candidatus Limnocylindrales bacterium]
MPEIRPFRALRFDVEAVGDLGRVVAPPYDVIGPAQHRALLARHPRNAVRLDLPTEEPGDAPDDRYRRAARTFAAWRSDGTLHKDPRPSIYVYEQTYAVPGSSETRVQRGFFGRLRLEPTAAGSGVLAHERTLSGPREDRYKLLRATGANMSPVVVLYDDPAAAAGILERIAAAPPDADLVDDEGTRHRLWALAEDGPAGSAVDALLAIAGERPVTIADGHHRYETALRYRDERRMTRSCETDPAYDFLLALFLDTRQPLTVLPTHRVVRGLGDADPLPDRLAELFEVQPASREALLARFGAPAAAPGAIGLWTRGGGHLLAARPAAIEALLPAGSDAFRALDVVRLQVALETCCGIDAAVAAAGGRLAYTKSAEEAMRWVDDAVEGADAAFLLAPTPVAAITAVAAAGEAMPQKSTYFHPKALTGLLINPHEW